MNKTKISTRGRDTLFESVKHLPIQQKSTAVQAGSKLDLMQHYFFNDLSNQKLSKSQLSPLQKTASKLESL